MHLVAFYYKNSVVGSSE